MPAADVVFMFSGQGSQHFQMGKELFETNSTFRHWMVRLDELARPALGASVIMELYASARGRGDCFDRTTLTHPAIFMVEYSLAQALRAASILPDLVLGVSLGSFAAAAVAGVVAVEAAFAAVLDQALALEEYSEPGGMTAVLTTPALFAEDFLSRRSELAAVNFSEHFVVSARTAELEEIEADLSSRHIGYQRLPVSFPFHSRWIDDARTPFESHTRSIRFAEPRVPLVCCDRGDVRSELRADFFWDVVRHPIRFRETIGQLERGGAYRYVDLGPGGTLATFLKYALQADSQSAVHAVLTRYGADRKNLAALMAAVGHEASSRG